jgi:hypothetical protein
LREERRFLGVEVPLVLQFSIALCTGLVAATLVPPVRKSIPRPVEVGLWIALILACVIGVVGITNPSVRELTSAVFWGVDQIITTTAGLIGAAIVAWIVEHRFPIANWIVLVYGADIMVLALLGSYRKGKGWQPDVRLREWMELPRLSAPTPEPVVMTYAIDELNRKWAAASAVAGAAILTALVNFSIWAGDVLLPRQAERLAHAAANHTRDRSGACRQAASRRAPDGPRGRHPCADERAVDWLVWPAEAGASSHGRGGGRGCFRTQRSFGLVGQTG